MDFNKIKCIIWDLDNTLWKGILAENDNITLNKCQQLLEYSSNVGIIHSICSKNNSTKVEEKLSELAISDFFVFNSINYEAKGPRLKFQILKMHLREENVLFIDDEIANLKEATYYCKNIMVSQPYIIQELTEFFFEIYQSGYRKNRIDMYKMLEKKGKFKEFYSDNTDFLLNSNIIVDIKYDCYSVIDRIFELIQRTNQLNFTKNRQSMEELEKDLNCCENAGYVTVKDKFGYYGIVGFFLIKEKQLKHFVFSCRIMNMGIEQYIYYSLNCPSINIVGEVASVLKDKKPFWINQASILHEDAIQEEHNLRILLKGSCDFKRMQLFLPSNINYEVQYVYNGKNIVYQTGIPTIAMTALYNLQEIREIAFGTPFYDDLYYKTDLFSKNYDIIFLSLISLANLGVYRHKQQDFFLSMGLPNFPMHQLENESKYSSGGIYANGFNNTKASYEKLRKEFDYINDSYVPNYLKQHLKLIIQKIKAPKIYLILGNEEKYRTYENKSPSGIFFMNTNKIVRETVEEFSHVNVLDLSDFVINDKDVINHFNHFSSKVYYELANAINVIISEEKNYE